MYKTFVFLVNTSAGKVNFNYTTVDDTDTVITESSGQSTGVVVAYHDSKSSLGDLAVAKLRSLGGDNATAIYVIV